MPKQQQLLFFLVILLFSVVSHACSVVYYIDSITGKIYVANNEDYWYDVDAYIQIVPKSKGELARLWYGWDDFAQGGINEAGLFFDGAVTPEQPRIKGSKKIKGNLGDDVLASCKTVQDAIAFIEKRKIALSDAHIMFGDATGNVVVIEWLDGERKIIPITNHKLIMTNFLLADPTKGNHPCPRYNAIQKNLEALEKSKDSISFLKVANTVGSAVQTPAVDKKGRTGGTLYSTFINISDMEFILVYKLDNKKIAKLDLRLEFERQKGRKIELNSL
ncbi:carcinine hydrolase/isopenicillin-N N-acyltransferase family protein [Ulvibacterium marinum]|uniref:carcinine hydrolase/isopenicillin-N N-acyltransferase family protein n=1 Tax=Ulvibacterium marinum TaxID=2419782 RepID=UPI0024953B5D|nr:carcinine hydrolase/isopenicillin-N N-acyltransferase family protein [Ulvibacterium marinum]